MIRIKNIKVDVIDNNLEDKLYKILNTKSIKNIKINKRSIDARKEDIYYVYEVDVEVDNEEKYLNIEGISKTPDEEYKYVVTGEKTLNNRPIIVGAGPSGLFCAYFLAEAHYNPIIVERGKKIDDRVKDVENFWNNDILDKNSNVVFGEGGAGTFSDGKLNTLKKDKDFIQKKMFEIFVENGASEEILYDAMPHIGTDKLREVIKNMREKIISMGGEFKFSTTLTDLIIDNNRIVGIEVNNKEIIDTDVVILALGHSAKDTFKMLYEKKLEITSKPFAVGIRIEHNKDMINEAQYGKYKDYLPAAYYKLTNNVNGRGVYTFCMCPGGYVINSSSEDDGIVINGMSNYKRDSYNSNSAVIVTVNEKDYGNNPLDGIKFQEELEKKAFIEGKGYIPVQLYKDLKENKVSNSFKSVKPVFKSKYTFANINNILPKEIICSIINSIDSFDKKIKGFACGDAIISAVETRTSSPIRIIRDDNLESSIKGVYVIGEGAGYAGGITSSGMDGVKAFESVIKEYKTFTN